MSCELWFSSSAQITLPLPVPRKNQKPLIQDSSQALMEIRVLVVMGTYKSNWNLHHRNKQGMPNPVTIERCIWSPPFLEAPWPIVHWGSTCFIVRIKMFAGSQHEVSLQPRDSSYTRHSCSSLTDSTKDCLYFNHLVLTAILSLFNKAARKLGWGGGKGGWVVETWDPWTQGCD